jgi:peptidoglycan lytic transglycosylase G
VSAAARAWRRPGIRAAVPLCLGAALLASCGGEPPADAPRAHVYIPRGATLAAVADTLEAHGVIEDAFRFRIYGRLAGLAHHVRPGRYGFRLGEPWGRIREALKTGRTDDIRFTVPEGLTVRQIAELAADTLRLARDSIRVAIRDSFLAAAQDPAIRAEFGIAVSPALRYPLEGYLLPETYLVPYDATPREVVRQMVRQFAEMWDTSCDRRAAQLGLSRHQVVTLASIVEGEVRVGSERPRIAGVYLNRLRRHMRLQADPTIIYALDLSTRPTRVLLRDLTVRSPYNTYQRPGLPPGPIGNPGRASIEATLDPERNNFYFFVARPDGRHMFSPTGRAHVDSVAVARRLRAEFEAHRADSLRAAAAASRPHP